MHEFGNLIRHFDAHALQVLHRETFSSWSVFFHFLSVIAPFLVYSICLLLILVSVVRQDLNKLYKSVAILLVVLFANYAALVLKVCVSWSAPDAASIVNHYKSTVGGFPSERTVQAASLAVAVALLLRNRTVVLCLALLAIAVAISRIYSGAYYPSQIIAAVILSAVLASLAFVVWKRLESSSLSP